MSDQWLPWLELKRREALAWAGDDAVELWWVHRPETKPYRDPLGVLRMTYRGEPVAIGGSTPEPCFDAAAYMQRCGFKVEGWP